MSDGERLDAEGSSAQDNSVEDGAAAGDVGSDEGIDEGPRRNAGNESPTEEPGQVRRLPRGHDRPLGEIARQLMPQELQPAGIRRLTEMAEQVSRSAMPSLAGPDVMRRLTEMAEHVSRSAMPSLAGPDVMRRLTEMAEHVSRSAMPSLAGPDVMRRLTEMTEQISRSAAIPLAQADVMRQLSEQVQQMSRVTMPGLGPGLEHQVVQQLRLLDAVTPAAVQRLQLATTAQLVAATFGNTALETWRVSLLAQADVARVGALPLPPLSGVLDQLVARTRSTTDVAARLMDAMPAAVLPAWTAKSVRSWQRYVAVKPTAHRAQISVAAGVTVGGLLGGNLLLLSDRTATDEDIAEIDAQLVEPWEMGPLAARTELVALVSGIDRTVADFLEGGWDDVQRAGAAAPSKVAHCVVEALDRTLRALAPEPEVLEWLHRGGRRPGKDDIHDERPTRRAKVAFVVRDRPGDRLLVRHQEAALAGLVRQVQERAQPMKHAPTDAGIAQARVLLVTVEALLFQLLVG